MGREAACAVRIATRSGRGKAHLDSKKLDVSGPMRFSLALADVREAVVESGWLRLQTPRGEIALELGSAAPAWAQAIRTPRSRLEKLGIKSDMRVCVLKLADAEFELELSESLGITPARAARGRFDVVVRGLENARDLGALAKLRANLEETGALWLVYRKGKGAPLPERSVRDALLETGLVDVKVVAFSDSHTALKAVIPLAQRAGTKFQRRRSQEG
jgi:hypothetical protein